MRAQKIPQDFVGLREMIALTSGTLLMRSGNRRSQQVIHYSLFIYGVPWFSEFTEILSTQFLQKCSRDSVLL